MKNKILSLIITSMLMLSLLCLTPITAVNAQGNASITTITAIVAGDVVPDLALNNAIRNELNTDADATNDILDTDVLSPAKMLGLTELVVLAKGVVSMEGLQYGKNIDTLNLDNNQITEINWLDNLPKLTHLNLSRNPISEIKGLDTVGNLTHLLLYNNDITEIKGLDNLSYLNELILSNNDITNIKGLDNLSALTNLALGGNEITKIEGLDNLPSLAYVSLNGNNITKIEGLDNLSALINLGLSGNQIIDLTPLNPNVNSTIITSANAQTPNMPTAINRGGTVTITNPSKNYDGTPATISNISGGGTYDATANTITWTNVVDGGAPFTFDFSVPVSTTNPLELFTGTVTVPYGPLAAQITLKYQDEAATTLSADTVLPDAPVGAAYTAPAPKTIANYTYKEVKTGTGYAPATGTYSDTPQTVVYVYTKNITSSSSDIGNPGTGHALPIAVVLIVGTTLSASLIVLKKNKA